MHTMFLALGQRFLKEVLSEYGSTVWVMTYTVWIMSYHSTCS